ncbi:MAG: phosphoenolpyruvate--protein phosphotransferase [Clostridia bacterium]|nr:phosphoenolpyruvate--protein phosphotransferase [Clostridia bacterium]
MLKGIGVSSGIGIGKVLLIEEHSLTYTPKQVTDTDAEKKRFNDAVELFCENTEKQAETLKVSAGAKEAEIMLGHISIVKDPFLLGEVEKLIDGGQCAEAAFETMCDMFIQIFSAADDDVTKQRAADVRDVKSGVLSILLGITEVRLSDAPPETVLCAKELTPSMIAEINKENIVGIITETGSTTSHSAILARVLEIPAVMSASGIMTEAKNGDTVIVDGGKGGVILSPDEAQLADYAARREKLLQERRELEKFRGKPTVSADGTVYELVCNIGKPEDAAKALEFDGEGVGLFRTEFLFMDKTSVPTEEEQFTEYKKAAIMLKGRPLIIRTLDIGGDKDIPYLGLAKEENPFMGFRAIRYCLKNRDLFKTQLRAILRASAFGSVSIMFPLITCVDEVREGKALVEELKAQLRSEGVDFDENIKVGIMTETAASGIIADLLAAESDFFSIGTNDLTGYTMAADRGNSEVSYLYSALQPSVLRMIKAIIEAGRNRGIPVGMCGEAAADPMMIPLLISFGLTEFSVSAPSVLRVRKCISSWTKEKADEVAAKVMTLATQKEVREYLSALV